MMTVQPIRDKKVIELFKIELLRSGYRDYMLFVIGINTGLRVSDILTLKVKDVKDSTHIRVTEKKTGKNTRFYINQMLRDEINRYVEGLKDDDWLFPSRKGGHIGRVQAWEILNTIANKLGAEEVGTHTLRKTFGYWHYKQHKDVALLQTIFNHSSPSITLRYIGISDDLRDKSVEDFFL